MVVDSDSADCNTNFLASSIVGFGVAIASFIGTAVAVVVGAGCISCCSVVGIALVVVVACGCSIIFGFSVVSTISFCVVVDLVDCKTNCLTSLIVGFGVAVTSLIGTTVDVVCDGCVSCCCDVGMVLVVVVACCVIIFGFRDVST